MSHFTTRALAVAFWGNFQDQEKRFEKQPTNGTNDETTPPDFVFVHGSFIIHTL
jgi:hypothetical protein